MHRPRLFFHVPSPDLVADVPGSIQNYWSWIHDAVARWPATLPDGQGACTWLGPYNWTVQTFLYLREAGVDCELSATLPEQGVILAHSDFLSASLTPSPRQFIVEMKPDRALHCALANFVVVQNRHDPICHSVAGALIDSGVVDYWPQASLVPRHPDRGDRFENVYFMGNADQFMFGVEELEQQLATRGLRWIMAPRACWHDYSAADAVVAIRRPASTIPKGRDPYAYALDRKPASKLTNAWLVGVPAVLSPDIAFRDLRQGPLDYLEAETIAQAVAQIDRLRADPALRRAMIDNGRTRAAEFSAPAIVTRWKTLVDTRIVPALDAWTRSATRRTAHHVSRRIARAAGLTL